MAKEQAQPLVSNLDCLRCGACCFQREGTILVTDADVARWTGAGRRELLDQLEPGHFGCLAFRMDARGCCVFHGTPSEPHACVIYEDRATVCREFAMGSAQCHEFRRDRGLE